jgi:hypothetical protein
MCGRSKWKSDSCLLSAKRPSRVQRHTTQEAIEMYRFFGIQEASTESRDIVGFLCTHSPSVRDFVF